jgi:hypothetical protein
VPGGQDELDAADRGESPRSQVCGLLFIALDEQCDDRTGDARLIRSVHDVFHSPDDRTGSGYA